MSNRTDSDQAWEGELILGSGWAHYHGIVGDTSLDQKISLSQIAKAAGMSKSLFTEQFRLATGIPLHRFVTKDSSTSPSGSTARHR